MGTTKADLALDSLMSLIWQYPDLKSIVDNPVVPHSLENISSNFGNEYNDKQPVPLSVLLISCCNALTFW